MPWLFRFLFDGYRRLLTHPRYGIWVLLASLVYLISPIDISPDLIPILGQIDDVTLIVLMLSAVSQWITQRLEAGEGSETSPQAAQTQTQTTAASDRSAAATANTIDVDAIPVEGEE